MEDTRSGGKARRGAGTQERAGTRPAVVGDQHGSRGCGDGGHRREPQRRELGPRRQLRERRSTGALTGADGAAGQRDAGRTVGTANSAAQSEKPDIMLKYRWNGVLYWCAGGVSQAAVRNRAALPGALAGIHSAGS